MPDAYPRPTLIPGGALVPGAVLSGYRLLRPVGGADGKSTWLARATGSDATVSVTVEGPSEAVERTISVQCRVRSPHVLSLVDLATDADGRVVLAWEHTDGTLAALLASRARLAPGEAVTILAPAAAGLAAIHRAGLSHGALSPASVLFCPDGRPVLGGLDRSGEHDQGPDRLPAAIHDDLLALGRLITAVAELVDEPGRSSFADVAAWLAEQPVGESGSWALLSQVECRLFAVARALPVAPAAERLSSVAADVGDRHRRAPFPVTSLRGVTAGLTSPARSALARSGLAGWTRRMLRGRGFAVCLGILVLSATLLGGLTAIPESDRPLSGETPSGDRAVSNREAEPKPATAPATVPATAPDGEPSDIDALTEDDAVAATITLLKLRTRCAVAGTTECVLRYAEPGSALADADDRLFGGSKSGGGLLLDDQEPAVQLAQAYGDVVLLRSQPTNRKRQPVFILSVRTDTGWRLRDLFEPD
jgi:serine/threonine protein kinase